MSTARWIASLFVCLLLLVGCSSSEDPTAPPSGWETDEGRWWQSGVDTATVFRNLENLETMGILDDRTLSVSPGQLSQEQLNNAVKKQLIALYRNDPATIDSLFAQHAVPVLEDVSRSGDIEEKIRGEYKTKAYQAINNHFREPRRKEAPGLVYPDSLQNDESTGTVRLQVHVAEGGNASAIEVLESVHPTLDKIALRATTQMVWQPAFVKVDGDWKERDSFVRFGIDFSR